MMPDLKVFDLVLVGSRSSLLCLHAHVKHFGHQVCFVFLGWAAAYLSAALSDLDAAGRDSDERV
jgi:hypothetical protein